MTPIPVTALCDAKHLTTPRLGFVVGAVVIPDDLLKVVNGSRALEFVDVTMSPRFFVELDEHALDDFAEASRRDALISATYADVT